MSILTKYWQSQYLQNHRPLGPSAFSRRENGERTEPLVLPSRCVSNAPQMNPTRKTFLLHTIRSTSAGLKAANVLQDPMSVLCIRQRTPGPLLRASRPFTAGEQPDSASSQCQTATQQAIPSDQPAANLYLSDEIDPMRLDGLRRNLFWIVKCVSFFSGRRQDRHDHRARLPS